MPGANPMGFPCLNQAGEWFARKSPEWWIEGVPLVPNLIRLKGADLRSHPLCWTTESQRSAPTVNGMGKRSSFANFRLYAWPVLLQQGQTIS